MGRPTKFQPEYVEQLLKLARETSHPAHMALWLAEHRRVSAPRKRKRQFGISQRIRNSVSARLWAALKGRSDGKLFSRLGYTPEQLCAWLEARFQAGMTWDNYGKWHVDHRKPCAMFDLTNAAQFEECWALDNLQPLWAADNIRKGARYVPA